MIDKNSLSIATLSAALPEILKEDSVYKDHPTKKYVYRTEYRDDTKEFTIHGQFYMVGMESDNVKKYLETSVGSFSLINCSEGAFALGPLAGKKVCIVDYQIRIDPREFESIRKEVNILKIKNKSPASLNIPKKTVHFND